MILKNKTKITLLFCLTIFLYGCSTKKKAWTNRAYHNVTSKYNGYFNAKESLKKGVEKIEEGHNDDYTKILSLYKTNGIKKVTGAKLHLDKTIKKSSVVIQRHSIRIKGKEYCKWIDDSYFLIGKAYFYKGEFDEATKTFNFIKNEYKRTIISVKSSLWLIRTYCEKGDFISAEIELNEVQKSRRFQKEIEEDLLKITAEFYLKQENYPLALDAIERLIKTTKKRRINARMYYIAAQISQNKKNIKKATEYYQKALKKATDYEMVFTSKMNISRIFYGNEKTTEKIEDKLIKMTKDEKNIDYLDQIYFTLAEIKIKKEDTLGAIKNYKLSTQNSTNNTTQNTLSFLSLAEIRLNQNKYILAKQNYDSVMFYIDKENKEYKQIESKHKTLKSLANQLQTITLEDSLQILANLSEPALQATIQNIIQKEREKELEKLENNKKQKEGNYNMPYNNFNEQFGNKTSAGKWYFYNPATLSYGLSEFRKKWGERKLEDDWRRKDKTTEIEKDTTTTKEPKTNNEKDPNYYLQKIPITEKQKTISNLKIKEAYYQTGMIFRENLQRYQESNKQFKNLIKRFPRDTVYLPGTLYNLYLNYNYQKKELQANETKEKLTNKFPESRYSKIIQQEKYYDKRKEEEYQKEQEYQKTYNLFFNQKYKEVLLRTSKIKTDKYKEKHEYIRAISLAKTNDSTAFKQAITELSNQNQDTGIAFQAKKILEILQNPSKMKKSNIQATNKTPYIYAQKEELKIIIVLDKKTTDITYFKTLISDHNKKRFSTEFFDIKAVLMGREKHLVSISPFTSENLAKKYYKDIFENEAIMEKLRLSPYDIFIISNENFQYFYKNKDIKGYTDFFKNNYQIK